MRPLRALLTALALSLGAVACSGDDVDDALDTAVEEASEAAGQVGDAVSEAASEVTGAVEQGADLVGYCTAAYRLQDAVEDRDPEDALDAAEDLAAEAPEDIRSDAETVLDGARAYQGGDDQAIQDEEFQTAVSAVTDHTAEHCDPRS